MHRAARTGASVALSLPRSLAPSSCSPTLLRAFAFKLRPQPTPLLTLRGQIPADSTPGGTFNFEVAAPMAPVVGAVVEELLKCTRSGCATTAVFSGCVFQAL